MKSGGANVGRVRSDERGRFVVENLIAGQYSLQTEPGPADRERMKHPLIGSCWEPRSATITVLAGKSAQAVIGCDMRDGVHVRGRVASGGSPVSEFLVRAEYVADRWGVGLRSVLGNSDGSFDLFLPRPGRWKVAVDLPNVTRKTAWIDLEPKHDTTLDFEFGTASARGKLVDANGKGVGPMQIWLTPDSKVQPTGAGSLQFGALVDGDGAFRIEHVDPGTYALIVQGRGEGTFARLGFCRLASGLRIDPGSRLQLDPIVLRAPGRVRARFRFPEGRSAPWVSISNTNESGFPEFGETGQSSTAVYDLGALLPGRIWLHVSSDGFAQATPLAIDVVSGETRDVEIELVPSYPVRVHVETELRSSVRLSIVDGAGAVRTWTCGLERVDDGSDFTIGGLPNGVYTITASDGRGRSATTQLEIRDAAPELVRIELSP